MGYLGPGNTTHAPYDPCTLVWSKGGQPARCFFLQERQRLLEEHATKLAAYLPKGVLQEDDIARLGLDPATTGTATSLPKF